MASPEGKLQKEAESLIQACENLLEAAPSVDKKQLDAERRKDLSKEIKVIGKEEDAKEAVKLLDEENFKEVEIFLLKQVGLSEAEFKEVIQLYIGERLTESLEIFSSQKANFAVMKRGLNENIEKEEEYSHVTPEDAIISVGGPLMKIDNQKMLKAQRRAEEAKKCMEHYGVNTAEDIDNPAEIIKDIRTLDQDIQALQEDIESYLGMGRDEIIQRYEKQKQENPYMN
jgi:hypothetical protein